jgi:hypothetical protein
MNMTQEVNELDLTNVKSIAKKNERTPRAEQKKTKREMENIESKKEKKLNKVKVEIHYYHVTSRDLLGSQKDVVQSFPIIL